MVISNFKTALRHEDLSLRSHVSLKDIFPRSVLKYTCFWLEIARRIRKDCEMWKLLFCDRGVYTHKEYIHRENTAKYTHKILRNTYIEEIHTSRDYMEIHTKNTQEKYVWGIFTNYIYKEYRIAVRISLWRGRICDKYEDRLYLKATTTMTELVVIGKYKNLVIGEYKIVWLVNIRFLSLESVAYMMILGFIIPVFEFCI